MTAEIAILNTYGVSLAADSAVTLTIGGTEKKIYNSANKVFTLSKYQPVGIMIYSNAQFMDIEWEIIIKEYRKLLGSKSFNTLFEYANSFLDYLKNLVFISEEQKRIYLLRLITNSIIKIRNGFISDIKKVITENGKISDAESIEILMKTLERINKVQDDMPDNQTFCLNVEYFRTHKDVFDESLKLSFENVVLDDEVKEKIFNLMFRDIQKSSTFPVSTGIVISGYGDDEIFPSIYNCNLYGVVESCLIRSKEIKNSITYSNKAMIMPFAQSEMVSSFMEGIDPVFEKTIIREINVLFNGIKDIIKEDKTKKTGEILQAFKNTINDFKRKVYIDPILSIVGSLQKSDLAEMAEALVNLTSFKRHVSTEAETVGGPTDVAIITKGDGFIWIKRKHYFNPDLNRHFFENYFRGDGSNE